MQPETLDGNNQYHCEKCNKKCDAHKGLKFSKFPYLLTLHLKRFDFDYTTLHRIKLNDKWVHSKGSSFSHAWSAFWQQCWWRFKSPELLRQCYLALVVNIVEECSASTLRIKQSKIINSENRGVFYRSGWLEWRVYRSYGPVYWVAPSETYTEVIWHQPVVLSTVWKGNDVL